MATGLSQPVLSHYLSRLEDTLGLVLCERGRGGFALTTEGEVVYQEAKSVIATLDDFANRLARIKHQLIGEARIGCLDNTVTHPAKVISNAIGQLYIQSPDVAVELEIGDYTPLMERLKMGISILFLASCRMMFQQISISNLFCREKLFLFRVGKCGKDRTRVARWDT